LSGVGAYYRWHAHIYDGTRWAFLFGRRELIEAAAGMGAPPRSILEVGCGTGGNLVRLARRFPQAEIAGLDLSSSMLAKARPKLASFGSRVKLLHGAYPGPPTGTYDLIVLSYCLSMINPGHAEVLDRCVSDLNEYGRLAIVDFHDTPFAPFRHWMGWNHVRMDGHLLHSLATRELDLSQVSIRRGYGGLWQWFLCVAIRSAPVFIDSSTQRSKLSER
jgi:S-adenosylmethionine-diacylgycerolhomoserine-N-methlytransferase